ncbi:MAG: YqhA family protein [Gammaproteobacteria bacterium]|nr:YqhA family protein [Gammaproteobacteria bacterium]
MTKNTGKIGILFESFLWKSRFVVLFAVIASLLTSLAVFFIATVDAYYLVIHLLGYASPALDAAERNVLRAETITHVVEIIDGYLLATVLLIFALGLYELFISRIDLAKDGAEANTASNVLIINSLDDLKARLAKVILMILIVRFFEHAISMKFHTPLDLLYLAAGIALIGLALYLTDEKGA